MKPLSTVLFTRPESNKEVFYLLLTTAPSSSPVFVSCVFCPLCLPKFPLFFFVFLFSCHFPIGARSRCQNQCFNIQGRNVLAAFHSVISCSPSFPKPRPTICHLLTMSIGSFVLFHLLIPLFVLRVQFCLFVFLLLRYMFLSSHNIVYLRKRERARESSFYRRVTEPLNIYFSYIFSMQFLIFSMQPHASVDTSADWRATRKRSSRDLQKTSSWRVVASVEPAPPPPHPLFLLCSVK